MQHLKQYIVVGIALIATAGTWYGAWLVYTDLHAMRVAHIAALAQLQSREARQEAQARMRATAVETKDDRTVLANITNVNVIDVAKTIEAAGTDSHAQLKVIGVTSAPVTIGKQAKPGPLSGAQFSVSGAGSFAEVLKAARLLDALPLASHVEYFDISLSPAKDSAGTLSQWQLSARVRVLTSASTL